MITGEEPIENKVAKSGLVVLELKDFVFTDVIKEIDIADHLVEGIALMEKPFRAFIAETDWSVYKGKAVAVFCSADAIIPNWAYMLLGAQLAPFVDRIEFGTSEAARIRFTNENILDLDPSEYNDQRVIAKGCGDVKIDSSAFGTIAFKLQPLVKSLMFGEPCSTVPVYKRK